MDGQRRSRPAGQTRESWPREKRSLAQWVVRGVLAVGAGFLALNSLGASLANVLVKTDPARAHMLSPGSGHITADLAEQRFSLEPAADAQSRPAQLARQALRQDATAVEALGVLGLQAQMRGDEDEARRLFTYSQALSRRELRSRVWAIEEAVRRGDIGGALEQYDLALRTSRAAPDLLFPVLASAVAEPRVRAELIADLAQQPGWGEAFIYTLASSAPDTEASLRLFREAERGGVPVSELARTTLVNVLVSRQSFEDAWAYYASIRLGADRRRSRDPNFSLAAETTASFDWAAISSAGVSATIQPGQPGGLVDFSAAPSNSGVVLQQLQHLPPGAYRLEGRSSGLEQPEQSLPYWALTCQDGRELGRVPLRPSPPASGEGEAGVPFNGRFTVPGNCPVQTLALMVRPSDQIAGVSGQIHRVQLAPAR